MTEEERSSAPNGISPFEQIRRTNAAGAEYWSSRDLAQVLGYSDYCSFEQVIGWAQTACFNSGQRIEDHFVEIIEMVEIGKGGRRAVVTICMSRYACCLIIQNAKPSKEIVALDQTYLAIQTRRPELTDETTEEERWLLLRQEMKLHNIRLASTAQSADVVEPTDCAIIQDHGHRGLYGGLPNRLSHTLTGESMHPLFKAALAAMVLLTITRVDALEINTTLMHHTYRIEGPTRNNETTYGTGFIMVIPDPCTVGRGAMVLITASHVLENIVGDRAKIYLRQMIMKGHFQRIPYEFPIREQDRCLWVRHPTADVAAIRIALPIALLKQFEEAPMLSTALLANDTMMEKYEVHPGDELLCLGYPRGVEANAFGFPVLRSGRIASYPLTPAKDIRSFLLDFEVFQGNSGGPVYFVDRDRVYGGVAHLGESIQFVAGIITQQQYAVSRSVTPIEVKPESTRFEVEERREPLGLGVVVPAHFIQETLALVETTPARGPAFKTQGQQ